MRFERVCLEALGFTLPSEIWSSEEIERRLEPVYSRLKLPTGRLELMTGIRERRFWPADVRPSKLSIASCRRAIQIADMDPLRIGCLIHGSVCRDFLEPATACPVHHGLELSRDAVIYDVSNACLGILNGILQAANMIELGQIEAALVVGSEGGRQLVETTIAQLNRDTTLTRKSIKSAVASLTIGSASCAVLLTHESISRTGNYLQAATVRANTAWHDLCQSDHDQAGANFQPLMATDSNELMVQGVQTGIETLRLFLEESGWRREEIDLTICHQVGSAHQKLMLESFDLSPERDFVTYPWLGNTGSAALPVTLACAARDGVAQPGQRIALLGIGSGINCIMLACEWKKSLVQGGEL